MKKPNSPINTQNAIVWKYFYALLVFSITSCLKEKTQPRYNERHQIFHNTGKKSGTSFTYTLPLHGSRAFPDTLSPPNVFLNELEKAIKDTFKDGSSDSVALSPLRRTCKLLKEKTKIIEEWSKSNIPEFISACHVVFYPFSGPDLITPISLFPEADTIILVGLEPVGRIPEFRTHSGKITLLIGFSDIVSEMFRLPFFKTKEMDTLLRKKEFTGVMPLLLFTLTLFNLHPSTLEIILIDSAQKTLILNYEEFVLMPPAIKKILKIRGVIIKFIKNSRERVVYYFSENLDNAHLSMNKYFSTFIDRLNGFVFFTKCASYLLHNSNFSTLRNFILERTSAIIQDDTGIPFHFFNDTIKWQIKLYGDYTKPIKPFGGYFQKDLFEAYRNNPDITKLPFHIGYHAQTKKDPIILAIRK